AKDLYRKAIELAPKNAVMHNNLAWMLATSPDPKVRDPGQAVELAQKAVELAPSKACIGTRWAWPSTVRRTGKPPLRRWRNRSSVARAATASTGSSWPWLTGS